MKIFVLFLVGIFAVVKGQDGETFYAHCLMPKDKGHLCFREQDGVVAAQIMLKNLDPCSSVAIHIHKNAPAKFGSCKNVKGHLNFGNNNVDEGSVTRNRSSSDGEVHLHRVPLDNKLSLSDRDPNKKSIIGRSVGVHQSGVMMCCKIEPIDEKQYKVMAHHEEEEDEPVDNCSI